MSAPEGHPSPRAPLPQGERGESDAPEIGEELARIPYEPLLPVEKKLIVYSLLLGAALLGILVWLSYTYFES
jgi:hypothetical protein